MSSRESTDLRRFNLPTIREITGLSGLTLYDPDTKECLAHKDALPAFATSRNPEISIIITTRDRVGYVFNCLQSIKASCGEFSGKYEIIVVDDCSTDRTGELLAGVRGLKVLSSTTNIGTVRGSNLAAREAKGQYLVLVNIDTIVASGWLAYLLRTFKEHPRVGAVGSKLVYPSGVLQEAGAIIFDDGAGWNYGRYDDSHKSEYQHVRDVDYCSGASLAVDKIFVRPSGIFDERFHPAFYQDTDLCFYIRSRGGRVLFQPKSVVIHFEGVTMGRDTSEGIKKYQVVNRNKFLEKWGSELRKQYNPDPKNVLRARDRLGQRSILVFDHRMLEHETNSGDLRMYNILRLLRSLEWSVTFFPAHCLHYEPYAENLRQKGIEVYCDPIPAEEFLVQRRNYYDFVLLSRVTVAAQFIDSVTLWSPQSVLMVDFPDLESVRELRHAKLTGDERITQEAKKTSLTEMELAKRADLVITITKTERKRLLKLDPRIRAMVIPNIYEVFSKSKPFDGRRDLLFVGGYAHAPNVDAVLYLVNEIFPLIRKRLPNVQLLIAGSEMPDVVREIHSPGVKMLGYVKDLTPLLNSCKVFVAPLRYGAGLKGKIVMAMAAGLPVVTSSIGAEGIEGYRRLLLIADDREEFANSTVQLCSDHRLWETLSKKTKSYVDQTYSPKVVRRKLLRIARISPVNLPGRVLRVFENAAKNYEDSNRMRFGDPMISLLSVYYSREDLQSGFPEARQADYRRLLQWATANVENNLTINHYRKRYAELSSELERAAKVSAMESSVVWGLYRQYARIESKVFPEGSSLRSRYLTLLKKLQSRFSSSP